MIMGTCNKVATRNTQRSLIACQGVVPLAWGPHGACMDIHPGLMLRLPAHVCQTHQNLCHVHMHSVSQMLNVAQI